MTYLKNYDNDIFVSYGHKLAEKEHMAQLNNTWTGFFCKIFTSTLNELLQLNGERVERGDGVRIWWDDEFRVNLDTDDQLQDRVSRSAIFLAFVSEKYDISDYCKQEATWFKEASRPRKRASSRIFIVRIGQSQPEKWPDAFMRRSGKPIEWIDDFLRDDGKPLGWPFPNEGHDDLGNYQKAIDNLADQVAVEIRAIEKEDEKKNEPLSMPPYISLADTRNVQKPSIYLAFTSEVLEETRQKLGQMLESEGFGVFAPDFKEIVSLEEKLPIWLEENTYVVQLVNELPGLPIPDKNGCVQYQLRKTKAKGSAFRAYWVSDKNVSDLEEGEYGDFIRSLELNSFETIEDLFTALVNEWGSANRFTGLPQIFVYVDKCDRSWAEDLMGSIFEYGVIPKVPSDADGDNDWKRKTLNSQGVVLGYGKADMQFIRQTIIRLNDLCQELREFDIEPGNAMPPLCVADVTPPEPRFDKNSGLKLDVYYLDLNSLPEGLDVWLSKIRSAWAENRG